MPTRSDLELEALVSTSRYGTLEAPRLALERRSIVDLCQQTQSIAEVSARLGIPVNVTRILVDDLSEEGLVLVHQPATRDARPSVDLLERVLHGLRSL